jgi:hypothetical protein
MSGADDDDFHVADLRDIAELRHVLREIYSLREEGDNPVSMVSDYEVADDEGSDQDVPQSSKTMSSQLVALSSMQSLDVEGKTLPAARNDTATDVLTPDEQCKLDALEGLEPQDWEQMSDDERRWKTVDLRSLRAKANKALQHARNEQHAVNHSITRGSDASHSEAGHDLARPSTTINQDS